MRISAYIHNIYIYIYIEREREREREKEKKKETARQRSSTRSMLLLLLLLLLSPISLSTCALSVSPFVQVEGPTALNNNRAGTPLIEVVTKASRLHY